MSRTGKQTGFNRPFLGLEALRQPAAKKAPAHPVPVPVVETPRISDENLFLQEVAGASPLPERAPRVGAPAATPRVRSHVSDDAEVLASLADLCEGGTGFDIADTDEYIEGLAEGVDRRLLKRLRGGDYAIQSHIDLHGLTQAEAKERVQRFVAASRQAGRRCVMIVHGRGLHSKDQIPVLKQALRGWLERGPIARSVLAFSTARPCDGGAGAVYVLLRR